MIRGLLAILIGYLLWSCSGKSTTPDKPASIKDTLTITSDTFNVRDLQYNHNLQDDIFCDTIEMESKNHIWANIIIPELSQQHYPFLHKKIAGLKKDKIDQFYEMEREEITRADSIPEDYGWYTWIIPLNLYKTDKIISFAFEDGMGYSGMPSGFEYKIFNFDLETKKEILFDDYFKMETASDTAFWAGIISRSVEAGPEEMKSWSSFLEWHGPVNFGFDGENIYFFFDRHDLFAGGQIGSVNKKYLKGHIKDKYL